MARIITKELAIKIARKLKAQKVSKKNRPHDNYLVFYNGRIAPAIVLDFLVQWLKEKLSEFLAGLLSWTKYTVAVIDVTLYLVYMLVMAALFVRKLWRLLVKQWSLKPMNSQRNFRQITRDAVLFSLRQYFWPITASVAFVRSLFVRGGGRVGVPWCERAEAPR